MSRLDLRELQISRMPGFETGGFRVDGLVPGLNILTGPNGSGKTTTARAIHCLLWPDRSRLRQLRPVLDARASLDGMELVLSLAGEEATISGGAPVALLGDPATASRYWLSLADLLANDSSEFAARVAIESHGGYSLAEAAKALGASASPRRDGKLGGDLRSTLDTERLAIDAESQVAQRAQQLEALRAQRNTAEQAHREAQQLEAAQHYLPLRQAELDAARELAEAFTAEELSQLARLAGTEAEELSRLGDRQRQGEQSLRQVRGELAEAERGLADLALPPGGLAPIWLEQRRRELREVRQLWDLARQEGQEVTEAVTRARDARRRCGPQATGVTLEHLATPAVDKVHAAVAARLQVQAERRAKEQALQRWLTLGRPVDGSQLQQARELLESWLLAGTMAARATLNLAVALLVLGGAGCGVWASALSAQQPGLWWLGLGMVSLLAALFWLRPERQRAALARQWPSGPAAPDSWQEPQVRARLEEVRQELAQAALAARCEADLAALRAEVEDLAAQEDARAAELSSLSVRYGVAPETAEAWAVLLVLQLPAWLAARQTLAAHWARRRLLRREAATKLSAWRQSWAALGFSIGPTQIAAEAALADLERRAVTDVELRQRIAARQPRLRDFEQDLAQVALDRAALLERVGLAAGELTTLERLVTLWPRYRALHEGWQEAAQRADSAGRLVEATLRELSAAEVETRLTEARRTAASLGALSDEVAAVEQQIRTRQEGHQLAAARAAVAVVHERIRADRELKGDALLLQLLHDAVEERQRTSLPRVVREANLLLAELTGRAWQLEVQPGRDKTTFRVRQAGSGAVTPLDHLSSGQRVQVLMAVRMAFVKAHEAGGPALPLLLDDASAISDDTRTEAIVGATLGFAKERQVFFCTARSGEVEVWRSAAEAAGVACRVVDLAMVRAAAA